MPGFSQEYGWLSSAPVAGAVLDLLAPQPNPTPHPPTSPPADSWWPFIQATAFPLAGVVLANVMAFSPVPTFLNILSTGTLGPTDPMPIVIMFGSAMHTFVYSLAIRNPYMYASNAPAVCAVGFSFMCILRAKDLPQAQLKTILTVALGSIAIVIINLGLKEILTVPWAFQLLGEWACRKIDHCCVYADLSRSPGVTFNVYQYLFFLFPLAQLRTIIMSKDASVLVPLLVTSVTINGGLWSVYGAAIGDWFIAGPNVAATMVGVAQLLLLARYGRSAAKKLERKQQQQAAREAGDGQQSGGGYRDDEEDEGQQGQGGQGSSSSH